MRQHNEYDVMPNDQFNVPCQQKNSSSLQNISQVTVYDTESVLLGAGAEIPEEEKEWPGGNKVTATF